MGTVNEGPGGSRIEVARLAIGSVHPSDDSIIIGSAVVFVDAITGRIRPKLLDDDWITRGHGHPHVRVPTGRVHLVGGIGIKMGSVDDSVARTRVGQVVGRNSRQVIGPANPTRENHIVSAGAANRRQEGLQTNAVESRPAGRSAALPSRPTGGIGFVEKVKDDRGIVRIDPSHRGPESH